MSGGQHARLSASQTKWWANCPGAPAYLEAHPVGDGGSGYHAQMGTCAHALSERCLREGSQPSDYMGRLIKIIFDDDGNEVGTSILKAGAKWPKDPTDVVFEVDVDMVEAVERMTGYVRRRCVELGLIPGGDEAFLASAVTTLVEQGTVRLEGQSVPLPDRDDTGGTSDVTIDAWPDLIEIVDYKHGSGVFVPVEGNEQVRSYGLGELLKAGAADYSRVRYTICQPRHRQSPEDGIMSEEVDASELLEWQDWLRDAAARVDAARERVGEGATLDDLHAEGLLSVGKEGAHCTFCPLAGGRCPAQVAHAQELAMADFDDEPGDLDADDIGPNRLAVLLPWVPFLDKFIKKVEADAERHMFQGGKIDGQKIVEGRSSRRWVKERTEPNEDGEETTVYLDEDDIARELREDFGLTEEQIYTKPKLITGPQAEKLVKAGEQRKLFNERLLHKPPGKLTIAPESDPKPAVEIDPAADFDELED